MSVLKEGGNEEEMIKLKSRGKYLNMYIEK